jgi:hypothetical protein
MVQGKLVVAMACVGLRECIRDEVEDLLVPLRRTCQCAAVLRVLNGPVIASLLGERGTQTVSERFSVYAYAMRSKVDTAHFASGLLKEIREAHERLLRSGRRQVCPGGLWQRLASKWIRGTRDI